ncbi:hypothetical protein BC567DRAFT_229029, partial [Phyllosticta citribraziliensis]
MISLSVCLFSLSCSFLILHSRQSTCPLFGVCPNITPSPCSMTTTPYPENTNKLKINRPECSFHACESDALRLEMKGHIVAAGTLASPPFHRNVP